MSALTMYRGPCLPVLAVLAVFVTAISANQELVAALSQHLHIQSYLQLSSGVMSDDVQSIKNFSKRFHFARVCHPETLQDLLQDKMILPKTMVVFPNVATFIKYQKEQPSNRIPSNVKYLVESSSSSNTSAVLAASFIPIDCDLWVAEPSAMGQYHLHTVYQLRNFSRQILEPYSSFQPGQGLLEPPVLEPFTKRLDFQGINFMLWIPIPDICIYLTSCLHFELWKDFGYAMNFSRVLVYQYHPLYDAAGTVTFFNVIREWANMLSPTLKASMNLYVKDTFGSHGDNWRSYSRPLEAHVWAALLAWLLLASAALTLVHLYLGYRTCLLETAVTPLTAICNQGTSMPGEEVVSRWSVLMPYTMAAVVFPAYAAAVISFITVQMQTFPFEDIGGFRRDGSYNIGSLTHDAFSRNYFRGSADLELQDIGRRLQIPDDDTLATYPDNLRKVCRKDIKFAFLAFHSFVDRQRAPCKIVRIPKTVAYTYAGTPIAPGSPFEHSLKLVLMNMHTSGVISRMQKELLWKYDASSQSEFRPITLPEVIVPIVVFAAGFVLSALFIALELMVSYRQRAKARRKRKPRIVRGWF